eukprot:14899603-Alexandrium_andersonii.AAC.4
MWLSGTIPGSPWLSEDLGGSPELSRRSLGSLRPFRALGRSLGTPTHRALRPPPPLRAAGLARLRLPTREGLQDEQAPVGSPDLLEEPLLPLAGLGLGVQAQQVEPRPRGGIVAHLGQGRGGGSTAKVEQPGWGQGTMGVRGGREGRRTDANRQTSKQTSKRTRMQMQRERA